MNWMQNTMPPPARGRIETLRKPRIFPWFLVTVLFALAAPNARAATNTVRCAILQYTERFANETTRDARRLTGRVREAAAHGAKIIVTPENALHRYAPWELNGVTMRELADQSDGLIRQFSALAAELKVCLVLGLRQPAPATNMTYQSAVFINRDGSLLKTYRKYQPSIAEFLFTRAGRLDTRPFETPYGRAWMQICKDMDGNWYTQTMPTNISLFIGLSKDPDLGWYKVRAGCRKARCGGIGANWGVGGHSGFVSACGDVLAAAGVGETILYANLRLSVPDVWWDAYEPDNTRAAAKRISNGRTQRRSIHAAGNLDWVRFTVPSAGARQVRLETAGPRGNTEMWLYRASGRLVAYDDDSGPGRFARITVDALPAGTYYLRIRESGNNAVISAYTLQARWSTP